MKILILCTGNSCRSQMAEGILRSINKNLEVFSAGTDPAYFVHQNAIKVMSEIGIDISANYPKHVNQFLDSSFDFVITVCDHANETCPVFLGKVKNRVHMGFEDPVGARGTDEEILMAFRKTRDEIIERFYDFYKNNISK